MALPGRLRAKAGPDALSIRNQAFDDGHEALEVLCRSDHLIGSSGFRY